MAVSMDQLGRDFYGRSTGSSISMDELYPKTSTIELHQGVPRYARTSGGTLIPSSGPLRLLDFDGSKHDAGRVNVYFRSDEYRGITEGYVLPPSYYNDGYMYDSPVGHERRLSTPDGVNMYVTAWFAGGVLDPYGGTITPATFRYYRVRILQSYRFYTTSSGARDVLGIADTNGLQAGTYNVHTGDRDISIIAKNRA